MEKRKGWAALATIGLADPDTGESRKPDHDKVNAFLARVPRPLTTEIDRLWDPDYDKGELSDAAGIAAIQEWREEAWRFAERLVEADTPDEEARVEQAIEEHAYQEGLAIREMTAYRGGQTSDERDAYCLAKQQP